MLLLTPPRQWWLILALTLPAHLAAELRDHVPLSMVLGWFVSNSAEALIGAACVRRFVGVPVRFDTIRRMGAFIVAGALVAPLVSSFFDAGFVTLFRWGTDTYWQFWQARLLSNIVAMLLVVPLIVTAGSQFDDLKKITFKRVTKASFWVLHCW